ncbi:MAG TPA: STAS domain-containing protein [Candidatus Baltobacteraceae bacterium]|nr:STAS domain-containing protein [Candidatus Baltobacteraceae bacterium]
MEHQGQAGKVILQQREYDLAVTDDLDAELSVLRGTHCVVDFRNVTYFDTSAMTVLIRVTKHLRAAEPGARVVLQNLSPPMRKLLGIAGLDRFFEIDE